LSPDKIQDDHYNDYVKINVVHEKITLKKEDKGNKKTDNYKKNQFVVIIFALRF
jgi:hypothetical protein